MAKTCQKDACNNPVFSKGYCKFHQYLRKDTKNYQYKRKPTGEKALFEEIWDERPRVSFLSGKELDFSVSIFAHVLNKKDFPKYRLYKKNIILLTPDEHFLLDMGTAAQREQYGIVNNCNYSKIEELRNLLKISYGKETFS